MKKALTLLLAAPLAGCTGTVTGGAGFGNGAAPNDRTPPTISIQTPERGSMVEGTMVMVSGKVTDDASSIAEVTVNGSPAVVQADGSFVVALTVTDGITIIETVAMDAAGNKSNDARSVLTGTMVEQGTAVSQGISGFISPEAMRGLSDMIDQFASGIDWNALALSQNPLVDTGDGCNSAKIYADSLAINGIEVHATPADGGIQSNVSIRNPVVHGHVNFRAICIGGSISFTISATSYDVDGLIAPSISAGDIQVALDNVASDFHGFSLSVGSIPGFITDLIEGRVRDKVNQVLRDRIRDMVPPQANAFLAGFLADSYTAYMFGQLVDIAIWPSAMNWTAQGGSIVLDVNSTVEGVQGASYLSTPQTLPSDSDMASSGIRIAMADDVLNQVLAGVWASKAWEDVLLPADGDALSAAFAGNVSTATISMMLPPVASFDTSTGTARLMLGDVQVEALDPNGTSLAKFMLSAQIDLAVQTREDGTVKLVTQTPHIAAQILSQSDQLVVPLDEQKVAAIAELAIKQLAVKADEMLDNMPVPGLSGASIMSPSFQPANGYLLMGGQLLFDNEVQSLAI